MIARFMTIAALSALLFTGNAEAEEKFHISGWGGSFDVAADDAFFQGLADAGFTHLVYAREEHLDAAARHGIGLYIQTEQSWKDWSNFDAASARRDFIALRERIGNHPALSGYALRDEPAAQYFAGLGAMIRIIGELDPAHEGYVNLFPSYASNEQLGCDGYRNYVERFLAECQPDMFGYDYYSLREDGSGPGEAYWDNLELFQELSKKSGVPFRFVLLASGLLDLRVPTEDDLRFQAFSAIAAGAKALEYFTYATPDLGNFRNAAVDSFGNKTETWYAARRVNSVIQAWAPVLNRLQSTQVYHLPARAGHELPAQRAIADIPGGDFFVGEFVHRETGDTWIMVVNKELRRSRYVPLQLQDPAATVLRHAGNRRGVLVPFEGEQCYLAPGQALLLKLQPQAK